MARKYPRRPKHADPRVFVELRSYPVTIPAQPGTPQNPDGEPERTVNVPVGHLRGGGPRRIETLHRKVGLDRVRQIKRDRRLRGEDINRQRVEMGLEPIEGLA